MTRHCVVGWLFDKLKRLDGASSIDVADDSGINDCGGISAAGAILKLQSEGK